MFYALTCIDGNPGRMIQRSTFNELVDACIPYAQKHQPDQPEDEIREELEQDCNWSTNSGDVWVYILQTDDELLPTE